MNELMLRFSQSMYALPPSPTRPAPVLDRAPSSSTLVRQPPRPVRPTRVSISEGEFTDDAGCPSLELDSTPQSGLNLLIYIMEEKVQNALQNRMVGNFTILPTSTFMIRIEVRIESMEFDH